MSDKGSGRLFLVPDPPRGAQRSDAELVAGYVRDESWASPAIWDRFAPMVRRMMRRSIGPGHDVEDLVQETFLRLYRKLPSLRDASSLKSFVITIATRVLQTELRGRWFRRWLGPSHDGGMPEQPGADADHDAREALTRFYGILDRLNATHRTAFALRYIEGLELVDVARAVGVSLATIKRWLPRIAKRVHGQAQRDPLLKSYLMSEGSMVVAHV